MGFFKYLIGILFLSIFSGPSALAQNYDPGSVIILKKNKDSLRNLDDIKKEQKAQDKKPARGRVSEPQPQSLPSAKQNLPKGITSTRKQAQSGPVISQEKQELDKKEQVLTDAYAKHLFTSVCGQDYRDQLAPRTEKNLDTKRMWTDIQASCKCLSEQVVALSSPIDLADYVMYNYGWQNEKKEDPELAQYNLSGHGGEISDLIANDQLRKKCGFLK